LSFAQVQKAAEQISGEVGPNGLHALVNNAGVFLTDISLEHTSCESFRQILETNVLGYHCVAKHFLPLLRVNAEKGGRPRLVFVGSLSGPVSTPFMAAYSASKAAVSTSPSRRVTIS
jgi:NAD(P)-dependent dehydrogenase (short-subunit alcohol dehydrogenase family)